MVDNMKWHDYVTSALFGLFGVVALISMSVNTSTKIGEWFNLEAHTSSTIALGIFTLGIATVVLWAITRKDNE
jgi:hypothetical protein